MDVSNPISKSSLAPGKWRILKHDPKTTPRIPITPASGIKIFIHQGTFFLGFIPNRKHIALNGFMKAGKADFIKSNAIWSIV